MTIILNVKKQTNMNKIKQWIKSIFGNTAEQPVPKRCVIDLINPTGDTIFRTGDFIMFSGNGFISNEIKRWTHSNISHVGIIAMMDGIVYVCESTTLVESADDISHKITKGVQFHKLENVVKYYDGQVYYYPQTDLPSQKAEDEMVEWMLSVHKQEVPYDTVQAILSGIDIVLFHEIFLFRNTPDFAYLFCSELVAKVNKIKYTIDKPTHAAAHLNPSEITPVDIAKSNVTTGCDCELVKHWLRDMDE